MAQLAAFRVPLELSLPSLSLDFAPYVTLEPFSQAGGRLYVMCVLRANSAALVIVHAQDVEEVQTHWMPVFHVPPRFYLTNDTLLFGFP